MNLKKIILRFKNSISILQLLLIVISVLSKAGMIFFISFLSKHMNLNDFGLVRYNITISNFYAIPMVGINSALVTFLSTKSIKSKHFFTFNSLLVLLFVIFLEAIYFFYSKNGYLAFFVLVALLDAFYIANLSGYNSFKKINFYRISQITIQLLLLYLVYNFAILTINYLTFLYFFSTIISIILIEIFMHEIKIKCSTSVLIIEKLIKFSNFALIGSISFTLYIISNAYFIKKHLTLSDFAKYSSIDIVSNLFTLMPLASASYLIANVSKSGSIKKSKKIINQNLVFYIFSAIFLFLFFDFNYFQIMNFIFKENSYLNINFFHLTCLNYILLSIHLYFSYYFFGMNKPKIPALSMTVGMSLNFLLSFYAIEIYGLVGLLYSNLVSIIFANLLIYTKYIKYEN
jgi:O-antigen/teichoic acid export membrane protein